MVRSWPMAWIWMAASSRFASAGPVPGARLGYQLQLVANGQVEARGVEARVDLPDAAQLDLASLPPGMVPDPDAGALTWRGRLSPDRPLNLAWTMSLDPALPPGARVTAQAAVQAPGVPTVRRIASTAVRATDFSGSWKRVDRAVAWPGQVRHVHLARGQRRPSRAHGHGPGRLAAGAGIGAWQLERVQRPGAALGRGQPQPALVRSRGRSRCGGGHLPGLVRQLAPSPTSCTWMTAPAR